MFKFTDPIYQWKWLRIIYASLMNYVCTYCFECTLINFNKLYAVSNMKY